MYIFCEVSIALEKVIAMEVKSGMSQQRQRDPYISWTMVTSKSGQSNFTLFLVCYSN